VGTNVQVVYAQSGIRSEQGAWIFFSAESRGKTVSVVISIGAIRSVIRGPGIGEANGREIDGGVLSSEPGDELTVRRCGSRRVTLRVESTDRSADNDPCNDK
jgi:hypothetical protein